MTLDALLGRYFVAPPECQELGPVPLPRLADRLRHLAADADLVLAVVPRAYAAWLGRGYLHVPTLLGFEQRVEPTLAATLAPATATVRRDARRALDFGYKWALSDGLEDFERFYSDFYQPFVRARFGPLAVVRERHVLRRHFRHGGGIVWLSRHGLTVAGELVRRHGGSVERLVQALAPDLPAPYSHPSPQAALSIASLQIAVSAGVAGVGHGGAVPSLRDGAFQAKRAWGATAHFWDADHRTLLVGWCERREALQGFLHVNPLVFGAAGRLAAVAAAAPGQAPDLSAVRQIWRQLVPRGVGRLFLLGASRWSSHAPDGRSTPEGPLVRCPFVAPIDIVDAATAVATRTP